MWNPEGTRRCSVPLMIQNERAGLLFAGEQIPGEEEEDDSSDSSDRRRAAAFRKSRRRMGRADDPISLDDDDSFDPNAPIVYDSDDSTLVLSPSLCGAPEEIKEDNEAAILDGGAADLGQPGPLTPPVIQACETVAEEARNAPEEEVPAVPGIPATPVEKIPSMTLEESPPVIRPEPQLPPDSKRARHITTPCYRKTFLDEVCFLGHTHHSHYQLPPQVVCRLCLGAFETQSQHDAHVRFCHDGHVTNDGRVFCRYCRKMEPATHKCRQVVMKAFEKAKKALEEGQTDPIVWG